ncbi:hypothetical protein [Emcibacter nanhaiensis]|uniref:Uncharacterized protein n=1 Tax=Emcibacter nanhaiensis TaxID=1505037 RepID=A0A501PSC7_9PROT|nr:hypothetical protein [Emcibacter nanhaiensis]TPD63038.1 hypothetical protein FIV46_02870 [Emcibacter nanhaiensis]
MIKKFPLYSIITVLALLYLYSMVLQPFCVSGGTFWERWKYVKETWETWQTFNAAMIALAASAGALIASYKFHKSQLDAAEDERIRNLHVCLANVTHELGNLIRYLEGTASVLNELWDRLRTRSAEPLTVPLASYSTSGRNIFLDCIPYAEPEAAIVFRTMTNNLQLINDRVENLRSRHPDRLRPSAMWSIIDSIRMIGMMRAYVDKLYEYARGETVFDSAPLTSENVLQAIEHLGLNPNHYSIQAEQGLVSFINNTLPSEADPYEP